MTFKTFSMISSACAAALALAGCGSDTSDESQVATTETEGMAEPVVPATPNMATATLRNPEGEEVGLATATAGDGVISVSMSGRSMPPGDHGIHIHMVGQCEGPKFESAGGHWNPDDVQHGLENPQGAHSGDMPNLTVASSGTGQLDYAIKDGNLDAMLDADGAAIVVHAKQDDQMTDPSGASGDRIACGVFERG